MKTSFVSFVDVKNVTQHSCGSYGICSQEEALEVSQKDFTTLLNIKDCTSRLQTTNHSTKVLSNFRG
ncbi:hypothetical protein HanIR_Chr03g0103701 [Helianthus annuus]|nr:hypothetical protein HanIR_Chr03g0103701 [Helianthus annuus]